MRIMSAERRIRRSYKGEGCRVDATDREGVVEVGHRLLQATWLPAILACIAQAKDLHAAGPIGAHGCDIHAARDDVAAAAGGQAAIGARANPKARRKGQEEEWGKGAGLRQGQSKGRQQMAQKDSRACHY